MLVTKANFFGALVALGPLGQRTPDLRCLDGVIAQVPAKSEGMARGC
jgi:hypothetical protein